MTNTLHLVLVHNEDCGLHRPFNKK